MSDVQEYPKWVTAHGGERVIVPDRQTEEAIVNGDVQPLIWPREAQGSHRPEVPSVGAPIKPPKRDA